MHWKYGSYIFDRENDIHIIKPFDSDYQFVIDDPKTVGQYTGFNDVNGLAIFEDDTIFAQTTYYGDILAHVVYEQGAFGYRPHDCKQINNPKRWTEKHPCVDSNGFNICDFYSFSGGYSGIDILSMEVASNIHDNPEPVESIPF